MKLDHTNITPYLAIIEFRKLFDIMAWQRPTKIVLPEKTYDVFVKYIEDQGKQWDEAVKGLTKEKSKLMEHLKQCVDGKDSFKLFDITIEKEKI